MSIQLLLVHVFSLGMLCIADAFWDCLFDSTKGYPGEGPRWRFRGKATPYRHGRPVPRAMLDRVRIVDPVPFVVSPVNVESATEFTTVSEFEAEYGELICRTPQYRGLGYRSLKSVLAQRSAICLDTMDWVPDPILVSRKVLETRCQRHEIAAGEDGMEFVGVPVASTSYELEEWYGHLLRRHIALGFTGRRALQTYLSKYDIKVNESVVRKWHDLYRSAVHENNLAIENDQGQQVEVSVVTEAELRGWNRTMRLWHHVEGLDASQVVAPRNCSIKIGRASCRERV